MNFIFWRHPLVSMAKWPPQEIRESDVIIESLENKLLEFFHLNIIALLWRVRKLDELRYLIKILIYLIVCLFLERVYSRVLVQRHGWCWEFALCAQCVENQAPTWSWCDDTYKLGIFLVTKLIETFLIILY